MLNHVQGEVRLMGLLVRSENGYGFLRPGLKTGVGNSIFWSEIGFGDAVSTPPPKISTNTPPPPPGNLSKGQYLLTCSFLGVKTFHLTQSSGA